MEEGRTVRSRKRIPVGARGGKAARWALLAVAVFACSESSLTAPPMRDASDFQTDSTSYTLQRTPSGYQTVLGVTYTNHTADTVSFVNCNGETGMVLQKRIDTTWTNAWGRAVPACLSPPIVVPPGGSWTSSITVFGGYPGTNVTPTFDIPDVTGLYRALWVQAVTDYQPRVPPFGDPIPAEHRISNEFFLR